MKEVTNEQIFELLQQLKDESGQVKGDLNQFKSEVRGEFSDLKLEVREMKRKVDVVYDERKQVEVSFTRSWSMASFFIAVGASIFTAFIVRVV